MDSTHTVDRILDAMSEIMVHEGIRSVTLDAIAQRAGVSKGGLLYHFPNKHALVLALVLRDLAKFETEVERRAAGLVPGAGRLLRAYVDVAFDTTPPYGPELLGALVGAFGENPSLLRTVAEQYQRWEQVIGEEADDRAMAAVVTLAIDGLLLADLMDLGAPEGSDREALRETLNDIASGRLRRITSDQAAAESESADE